MQVKSLKRKLRQALKTMKSQKKEIESLQNQLTTSASKSRATLEAMLAQVSRETKEERDRLQLQISSLERHKSDYERRESELIAEVKRLEKKLEVALGRAQNLRVELDAKVANIQELLSERERLRQQLLEETDANQQQLNQSLQQLSLKDAENTALKRDYNALKDETSALRQELTRHGNLMLSLQGDAKQLADDRNRLAALLSENDVKNSAVALEKDRVDSQMGSMREENSKLKHSIKVHEQNLASLQLQVKSQDSELKQLKSELSKRNELLNNLRKSNDEKLPLVQNARSVGPKETAKSLEELRKENAALLGELNSCKASISKLQNDVEVCQKEHKQGSKFDQNVEDTSAKTQSQVDRQRKQLEAELLQFKQQCSELTSVVDSLKNNQLVLETSHDETVSRLQSHNAELLAKLASAERRCRSLEQQHKFDFDEAAGGSCRMDADHGNAVSQSILGLSLEPLSPSPSLSSESSLCSVSPEGETTDDNESLHGECDSKVPGSRLHAGVLELESHMDLLNRQLSGGFEQGCDELPKVVS
jgi:chromosome segregation ATPase